MSVVDELRAVLAAERDAIRRLDGPAVTRASEEKERILAAIQGAPPAERAPLLASLREVREDIRKNLVLLAHARDCMRDAIEACAPAGPRRARVRTEL